jgi:hypothetical protein
MVKKVTSLGERPKPEGAAVRGKKSGESLSRNWFIDVCMEKFI